MHLQPADPILFVSTSTDKYWGRASSGSPPILVDGGDILVFDLLLSCVKRITKLQDEPSLFILFIVVLDDLAEELMDSSEG